MDFGTTPLAPERNPRPTYERLENYEVFEERNKKCDLKRIKSQNPGDEMKENCGRPQRRKKKR